MMLSNLPHHTPDSHVADILHVLILALVGSELLIIIHVVIPELAIIRVLPISKTDSILCATPKGQ